MRITDKATAYGKTRAAAALSALHHQEEGRARCRSARFSIPRHHSRTARGWITACSLSVLLCLTGCSKLHEDTGVSASTEASTESSNYLWESIPDGSAANGSGSGADTSHGSGQGFAAASADVNTSANTDSSDGTDKNSGSTASISGSHSVGASDTTDDASAYTADTEDIDSLWDDIPGEDTWGPFPDGEETSLCYAYKQLDSNEQLVYAELRRMIRTREETNLSTFDKEEVNEIYNAVLADHPEIFYVDGYTITSHTRNGALEYLSARANYVYDEEETAEYERLIDTAVDSILLQAPTDGSDYDKVKFCYEYLIRNTSYDTNAADNQNIISVFLNHSSVCNGYAKAMQYLLLEMDVPATTVTGRSANSAHAWDLISINGLYYYADPTWGDAQFTNNGSVTDSIWITYDYLNITTADVLTNHTFDNVFPLPVCSDLTYNYYVQEGLYFTTFDKAMLHRIANAAYESGELVIRFRCADAAVYQEMVSALIDNQEIYNYLYQANGISYTKSDSLYTMAIIIK